MTCFHTFSSAKHESTLCWQLLHTTGEHVSAKKKHLNHTLNDVSRKPFYYLYVIFYPPFPFLFSKSSFKGLEKRSFFLVEHLCRRYKTEHSSTLRSGHIAVLLKRFTVELNILWVSMYSLLKTNKHPLKFHVFLRQYAFWVT